MTARDYEVEGRARKALALIDVCRGAGWDAEDVQAFGEPQWAMLADATGVNLPSEKTRALVVHALERDARRR